MTQIRLTATRGLPGSGKSTWARAQQMLNPGLVLISKDELRLMLFDGYSPTKEIFVVAARDAIVAAALHFGRSVICHDTNVAKDDLEHLERLAKAYGAEFAVQDFTHVGIDECIHRQANRPTEKQVPETAIRRLNAVLHNTQPNTTKEQ